MSLDATKPDDTTPANQLDDAIRAIAAAVNDLAASALGFTLHAEELTGSTTFQWPGGKDVFIRLTASSPQALTDMTDETDGARATIRFGDSNVTVQHDPLKIALLGETDFAAEEGDMLILISSNGVWEEFSRKLAG